MLWGRTKTARELCRRYPVAYIVDKNDELCDLEEGDVCIFHPAKLYGENPMKTIVVICVQGAYREITADLYGIGDFTIFYAEPLLNAFVGKVSAELWNAYGEIQRVKDSLADDMSKRILQECVVRRICGCQEGYGDLKIPGEIQYLYRPALLSKQEGAVLDLGGYIGDSVDRFVNALGDDITEIDTFEALPENIKTIQEKKEKLKQRWHGTLKIFPYAVADVPGQIAFYETEKKAVVFPQHFGR